MLDDTLASLGRMRTSAGARAGNASSSTTTRPTTRAPSSNGTRVVFPVPLRYLFEARQGRSSALNAGIAAAHATILVITDDDVRVADGWLDAACDALMAPDDGSIGFAGGPVAPRWEAPPPPWLDLDRAAISGARSRFRITASRSLRLRGAAEGAARREHGRAARGVRSCGSSSAPISGARQRTASCSDRKFRNF